MRNTLVLILWLHALTEGDTQQPPCRIARKVAKPCKLLSSRQMILAQSNDENSLSYIKTNFTCKRGQCRSYVCCPKKQKTGISITPDEFQSPIRRPEPKTVPSRISGSGFKTNHPNRRLLPEELCGRDLGNKIFGGIEADLDEHTWMARLRFRFINGKTKYHCGGSLISSRYVLTAAHCTVATKGTIDQVRLGEHDADTTLDCQKDGRCSPPTDDIDVEEVIAHPLYKSGDLSSHHDIALIRLAREVELRKHVQPICLPLDGKEKEDYKNVWAEVAGWGRTSNEKKSSSNVKVKIRLAIVPREQCEKVYAPGGVVLLESQICAGGEEDKDSCQGDSGGGLVIADPSTTHWQIIGLVSFGYSPCGQADQPSVYTRVASYIDWILDNIRD